MREWNDQVVVRGDERESADGVAESDHVATVADEAVRLGQSGEPVDETGDEHQLYPVAKSRGGNADSTALTAGRDCTRHNHVLAQGSSYAVPPSFRVCGRRGRDRGADAVRFEPLGGASRTSDRRYGVTLA